MLFLRVYHGTPCGRYVYFDFPVDGTSAVNPLTQASASTLTRGEINGSDSGACCILSYERADSVMPNARVVATNEAGVMMEHNCVSFSQLYKDLGDDHRLQPCGIVVLVAVDDDELYPYSHGKQDVSTTDFALIKGI